MRNPLAPLLALGAATAAIVLMLSYAQRAEGQVPVSTSANTQEYEYEWCPSTASTVYPGSPPSGAKSVYIQNRSKSATCYVRFDALGVTTTGATGYEFGPGDERSIDAEALFAGQMRGACTAATSTGACLYTSWWK